MGRATAGGTAGGTRGRAAGAAGAAAAAVLLGLVACAGGSTSGTTPGGPSAPTGAQTSDGAPSGPREPSGEVTVLAAASLEPVVTDLARRLERDDPSLEVRVSYGASPALAQQVLAGAPADVVVTASEATMRTLTDAGEVDGAPVVVATNSLQIAVPQGDPAGVAGLDDLADPDLLVALCAPEVPCGAAAVELLGREGVDASVDTFGRDASATLTLVRLGEVDAALVYRTDVVRAGGAVDGVEAEGAGEVVTRYPAAVLRGARNPGGGAAVVDLLVSAPGREALGAAGFALP